MSQAQPASWLRRFWKPAFILIAGLGICSVLPLVMSTLFAFSALPKQAARHSGDDALPVIRQWLGAALPPSATDIEYYYESWTEYFVYIRLRIVPDDLVRMIAAVESEALCSSLNLQDDMVATFVKSPAMEWWTPQTATVYASGQCGGAPLITFMVDKTQTELWTVYLELASL
jgi:hypothetical protein